MKIRQGFVSNSSSSSFIIKNPKENLTGCFNKIKLTKKQIKKVKKDFIKLLKSLIKEFNNESYIKQLERIEKITLNDDIYITNYISDCLDEYGNIGHKYGIEYLYGGHGIPYSEKDLICLNDDEDDIYKRIYILK